MPYSAYYFPSTLHAPINSMLCMLINSIFRTTKEEAIMVACSPRIAIMMIANSFRVQDHNQISRVTRWQLLAIGVCNGEFLE